MVDTTFIFCLFQQVTQFKLCTELAPTRLLCLRLQLTTTTDSLDSESESIVITASEFPYKFSNTLNALASEHKKRVDI